MHILDPKELERRKQQRKKTKKPRRRLPVKGLILLVAASYLIISLFAVPLPKLEAELNPPEITQADTTVLPWPAYGQAAVGAVGYGMLAKSGEQKQAPIASMAKVITALAVLKVKPMPPNGFGETIVITGPDVETYFAYASQGQSVVRVQAGQQLTQYQALQALLLPSANNMADILVRWAFGSTEEYLAFVNPFVATLGLNNTKIADASGFSPNTVSTAEDMVKLAEIAMNDPLLAAIVAQPQANLPVAGTVRNINSLLGTAGVVGIKTGNTDQAGGCFMFASKRTIANGEQITVFGVVMGAPERSRAIGDSLPLIEETFRRFSVTTLLADNQQVGKLAQATGRTGVIQVDEAVSVVVWSGVETRVDFAVQDLGSELDAGQAVGTATIEVGDKSYTVKLVAGKDMPEIDYIWRLRHLGGLI